MATDNHNLNTPAFGTTNWHTLLNQNFQIIEESLVNLDTDANKTNYTAWSSAVFIATDTNNIYYGDGASWNLIGEIGGGGGSNANPAVSERVEIPNTETYEIPIPVPDGQTLTVEAWGLIEEDRSALPSGLTMQLWNDSDVTVTSESTTYTASPASASITNSSVTVSWYKIVAHNNTGTDYMLGAALESVLVYAEWSVA